MQVNPNQPHPPKRVLYAAERWAHLLIAHESAHATSAHKAPEQMLQQLLQSLGALQSLLIASQFCRSLHAACSHTSSILNKVHSVKGRRKPDNAEKTTAAELRRCVHADFSLRILLDEIIPEANELQARICNHLRRKLLPNILCIHVCICLYVSMYACMYVSGLRTFMPAVE